MLKRQLLTILTGLLLTHIGFADELVRTIDVTGVGKVHAIPDLAMVSTGVVTKAETAKRALAANSKAMNRVMSVLDNAGIAEKDRQTSGFSVQPEYRYYQNNEQAPKIIGYIVSNQLRVKIRDFDNLGKVLDALVNAGSNQISGISFSFADMETLMDQARQSAMKNALQRAQLYAAQAGVGVGKVLSIREQTVSAPAPMMMKQRGMAYAEAAMDVPVSAGESELSASITVSYEIVES